MLKKLHPEGEFESLDDLREFEHRLARALEKGAIERVPVKKRRSGISPEEWYRVKGGDDVYRYVVPDYPLRGYWGRVEKPEEGSYFQQLYAGDAPTREEYAELTARLAEKWREGEVERAEDPHSKVAGTYLFHHRPSDETFELFPPNKTTGRGIWEKVFRSNKDGSWPGQDMSLDVPPTSRFTIHPKGEP
ncbi:hypothetical protein [Myxococcus stipitatus]|uniref:hypothetical protein n=1 Tax=Myxococcus stipitatus TaxID=83455 RepID=UPI0003190981|nr:hypothetical protein [Myxococcus stipitatus]